MKSRSDRRNEVVSFAAQMAEDYDLTAFQTGTMLVTAGLQYVAKDSPKYQTRFLRHVIQCIEGNRQETRH